MLRVVYYLFANATAFIYSIKRKSAKKRKAGFFYFDRFFSILDSKNKKTQTLVIAKERKKMFYFAGH